MKNYGEKEVEQVIIRPFELEITQSTPTDCIFTLPVKHDDRIILYSFEMPIKTLVHFVKQIKQPAD